MVRISYNIRRFTKLIRICNSSRRHDEVQIYGTGGMILQNMKDLLQVIMVTDNHEHCHDDHQWIMMIIASAFPVLRD